MQDESVKGPDFKESGSSKNKKSLNKKVILSIVGVLLLIAGAVCAYFFWYQHPQKVITDAASNMLAANQSTISGYMNVNSAGDGVKQSSKIDFTLANVGNAGKGEVDVNLSAGDHKIKAKAEAIFAENKNIYIKVTSLQNVVDAYIDVFLSSVESIYPAEQRAESVAAMKNDIQARFNPLIDKIDDKWILVTPDDFKSTDKDANKLQTCMNELSTMLNEDKTATSEIRSAYSKNQFIKIDKELGSKDGALGYEVSVDETKLKAFKDATEGSKLVKKIKSCVGDNKKSQSVEVKNENKSSVDKIEVWVDRWSHNLRNVSVNGRQDDADMKTDIKFDFTSPVKIDVPKETIPVKEVMKEIRSIFVTSDSAL